MKIYYHNKGVDQIIIKINSIFKHEIPYKKPYKITQIYSLPGHSCYAWGGGMIKPLLGALNLIIHKELS